MRIQNTVKNALVGTSMQLISMIFSFVTRAVFLRTLAVEYLGVESVFADLINMLSIAEMGFATAITYSLYEPIKNNRYDKINSIMKLYKKIYETVGILILISGLALTPFIPSIISSIPQVSENIYFLFVLFLLNSVIGYFFSYKQTLIIANQQDYIVQRVTKLITVLSNIIQIVTLYLFRDFVLYFMIKIITTFIINLYLSKIADSSFKYLKLKDAEKLEKEELTIIKKNIGAMFIQKIGYRIVFSTDNIFIGIYTTIGIVGRYANYDLVRKSLSLLLDMVLNASAASVGNLNVEGNNEKSENIFQHILFLNFILYSFSAIMLSILMNDFVSLWLGTDVLLSELSLLLIVANFFVHGMRRTVIIFRDSWGLFYKDRYKPILEIIMNVSLQIYLGSKFGLNGILLGTSLSILLSSFWIEPLILYKFGFEMKVSKFFKIYFKYSLKMMIFGLASYLLSKSFSSDSIISFGIKVTLSGIVTIFLMYLSLYHEPSMKYYRLMLKNYLIKRKR